MKTDSSFQKALPRSFTITSPSELIMKVVGIPEVAKNSYKKNISLKESAEQLGYLESNEFDNLFVMIKNEEIWYS